MPFYTKPLSQLDTADLKELLGEQAVENARLEFKLTAPDKDATLKKLSSFANTFGGYMLVGAKADSKDGRLLDLPGVDPIAGYKQKVVDWCFAGASPPLSVEVSDPIPTPTKNGKVCYAIYVSESDVAPHFLNGRKGVWVRTDEFSAHFDEQLANDVELRHLMDRRQLIRERRASLIARAKKRFNTFLDHKHKDKSGQRTDVGPLFEFGVVPRFPARQLCSQKALKQLLSPLQTRMGWRNSFFPLVDRRTITQHESEIVLDAAGDTSILEANVWGMLYYATTVRAQETEGLAIHTPQFLGSVLLFVFHAGKILEKLGYSGPLIIESTLGPFLKVPWIYSLGQFVPQKDAGSQLDDEIIFSIPSTAEDLRLRSNAVALEVVDSILYSANLAHLVEGYPPETLLKLGYAYNGWGTPPPQPL
jgi:hypothetical protein